MGTDGEKLRSFYAELFGWAIDAGNPLGYESSSARRISKA
jgi:hypothetical protein